MNGKWLSSDVGGLRQVKLGSGTDGVHPNYSIY